MLPLGQVVGHPLVEVGYPSLLPHEAMYRVTTERGMDAKHANCVEERLDQMLGDMDNNFCKQLYRDAAPCSCIGCIGNGAPVHTVCAVCQR